MRRKRTREGKSGGNEEMEIEKGYVMKMVVRLEESVADEVRFDRDHDLQDTNKRNTGVTK